MDERRPGWVYDVGQEPDPRFSLANERTFLAWVRTGLGLVAGGVAIHSLGQPEVGWVRTLIAVALVLLGGLLTGMALLRWARTERAMRLEQPLPSFSLGILVTLVVVVIAALLGVAFAID